MSLDPKITKEVGGVYWLNWTPDPTAEGYAFTTPGGSSRTFDAKLARTKLGKNLTEPVVATVAALDVEARPAETSRYPATPPPPPPPPPPPVGIPVPDSIDGTGSSDVTSKLLSWIDSVPNGSTLDFLGKTFRVDGTIELEGRSGLVFNGGGATIRETTIGDGHNSKLRFYKCGGITVRRMNGIGAFATPGQHDINHQWGHFIDFLGVRGGSIEDVTARNFCGDGAYIGGADSSVDPHRSSDIAIRNLISDGVGRNHISATGVDRLLAAGGKADHVGFIGLDVEPNESSAFGVFQAVFEDILIGKYRLYACAVVGDNQGDDVTFRRIHITSQEAKTRFGVGVNDALNVPEVRRRKNLAIVDCVADVASGVFAEVHREDGLTVTGNKMPGSGTMLQADLCTGVVFSGNTPNTKTGA